MNAEDGASESEPPTSYAPDLPLTTPLAASTAAAPALGYADFAAAVKDALRDVHSPDLLARNPLLLHGVCNLGKSAGPQELRALLSETVSTLFANPRDEKLSQVLKLTYCQPGLKQEAVADRLSLSFGTYRRHLLLQAGLGIGQLQYPAQSFVARISEQYADSLAQQCL